MADALAHYARHHKGGPAHKAAFDRAIESITKVLASRTVVQKVGPERVVSTPYRDD